MFGIVGRDGQHYRKIYDADNNVIAHASIWKREDGPHLVLIEYTSMENLHTCEIRKWFAERGVTLRQPRRVDRWVEKLVENDLLFEFRMTWL